MAQAAIDRILRKPEVLAATGYGATKLWMLTRDGLFPRPIHLGPQMRGWFESEVIQMNLCRGRAAGDDEIRALVQQLEAKRKAKAA
ncbi:MAG: AlpA family phage regulatory protein [Thermoanaerobaculia bacterium]